jgi:endonuclease G
MGGFIKKGALLFFGLLAILFLLAGAVYLSRSFFDQAGDQREAAKNTTNPAPTNSPASDSIHLLLGNPSGATADEANEDNFLMVNSEFALSYNRSRGTLNWSSWYLKAADVGNDFRKDFFEPDPRLPRNWRAVTHADYIGSGYDRGHICPSADRGRNQQANASTFLMTNIVPQARDNNQGPWRVLEEYCRYQVKKSGDLYIISGVYGEKERLRRRVAVPTNLWKVIVFLPRRFKDISQINEKTQVIAVDMPNIDGIKEDDWRKYQTSIRAIEYKTGYNLLSSLPDEIQESLEARTSSIQ